jgi:cytochrome o ubiquinol oxidase subunit 3
MYLMTDCVLFAALFATYAVLRANTNGGPGASELFSQPFVLAETLILLTSSYTAGLSLLAARSGHQRQTLAWLIMTGALGVSFLGLELSEFAKLAAEGNSWARSGFLSAYFTLVGTHGLHIVSGLVWMAFLLRAIAKRGLTAGNQRRLGLLSLFWHFLDVIWIFIFTFVYLLGAVL